MGKLCESRYNKGHMRYVVQQAETGNKYSWFATLAGYAIPVTSFGQPFGTKQNAVKNAALSMYLYPNEYREAAKRHGLKITQVGVNPVVCK